MLLGSWAVLVAGCPQQGFEDEAVGSAELLEGGETASGGWESAPFPNPQQCEKDDGTGKGQRWLELDGRTTLEVPHGLGRAPTQVLIYIAFEDRGCGGTLASGDLARLCGVDDERIFVENATTQDFFMRVYVE